MRSRIELSLITSLLGVAMLLGGAMSASTVAAQSAGDSATAAPDPAAEPMDVPDVEPSRLSTADRSSPAERPPDPVDLPAAELDPADPSAEHDSPAAPPEVGHAASGPSPEELTTTYQVLQLTTAGMLAATAVFGAIQAYNLPTSLGDGACASPDSDPVFDDYGCVGSLSTVHGGLGIATLLLYTATGTVGVFAPERDPEPVRDVLSWVHAIGLGLTGLAGILGRYPDVIGVDVDDQPDFSRHTRTVHISLALTTATAFITHVLIDLID